MADLRFDNQRGTSVPCDLVDVVRCKDCEFWTGDPADTMGGCRTWSESIEMPEAITYRYGFCHMGSRKD